MKRLRDNPAIPLIRIKAICKQYQPLLPQLLLAVIWVEYVCESNPVLISAAGFRYGERHYFDRWGSTSGASQLLVVEYEVSMISERLLSAIQEDIVLR
mmetsp:Transcript_26324/g.102797  ORF Transcript_26324/g.102797 Transcript_26324/m.102797 type:complete len:98 (-) Transcript_26324:1283-1576(-)